MGIFDFWDRKKLKEQYEGQIREIGNIVSRISDPEAKKSASDYLAAAKLQNVDTASINDLRNAVEKELPSVLDIADRKLNSEDVYVSNADDFRRQQGKSVSDEGAENYAIKAKEARDRAKISAQNYERERLAELPEGARITRSRAFARLWDLDPGLSRVKIDVPKPELRPLFHNYPQIISSGTSHGKDPKDIYDRAAARRTREREREEYLAEEEAKNKRRLMMDILRLKNPKLTGETKDLSDYERADAKIEWDSLGQLSLQDLDKMKKELENSGQVRKQYYDYDSIIDRGRGVVGVRVSKSKLDMPDTRWYASKNLKRSAWSRFMGKDKNVVDVNKRLKELNGLHEKDWKKKEYELRDLLVTRENYERAISSGKLSPFQEAQYKNEINKINRRLTDLGILDVEKVTSSTVGGQLEKLKSSHVSEHSKSLDELRKKHGLREGEEYKGSYGGALSGLGSWLGLGEEPASGVLVNIFALIVTWLIITNGIVGPILDTFAFFIPFISILKYPIYIIGIIIFYQFVKAIFYPFKEDFLALGHHHEMTVDDVPGAIKEKATKLGSGVKSRVKWAHNKVRGRDEDETPNSEPTQ